MEDKTKYLLVHEGQLMAEFAGDGFVGWKPVREAIPLETLIAQGYESVGAKVGVPLLLWQGGKITIDEPSLHHPNGLWREVGAYCKWAWDNHKSEAQVRLYYDQATRDWRAWAFPQIGDGATVKWIENDPDTQRQSNELGSGYKYSYGTIHSHNNFSAFQSGTDTNDEQTLNGIHLTIGKLDEKELDIDARAYMSRIKYKVDSAQWFTFPESWMAVPVKFHEAMLKDRLVTPPAKDLPFPEIWKSNHRLPERNIQVHGWSEAGQWNQETRKWEREQAGRGEYQAPTYSRADEDANEAAFLLEVIEQTEAHQLGASAINLIASEVARRSTSGYHAKKDWSKPTEEFIKVYQSLLAHYDINPWRAANLITDDFKTSAMFAD